MIFLSLFPEPIFHMNTFHALSLFACRMYAILFLPFACKCVCVCCLFIYLFFSSCNFFRSYFVLCIRSVCVYFERWRCAFSFLSGTICFCCFDYFLSSSFPSSLLSYYTLFIHLEHLNNNNVEQKKKRRRWKQNSVNVSTPIFFFRFFFPFESWAFNKLVDLGALSIQYLLLFVFVVVVVAVYVWATTLIAPFIFILFFLLLLFLFFRSIFSSLEQCRWRAQQTEAKKHQHTLSKLVTKWKLTNVVSVSMLMTMDHKRLLSHRLRYGKLFRYQCRRADGI